jgi:hypothetical protein
VVPNLRIMETDIDRLPWDHELFTHVPEIENGHLIMPQRPVGAPSPTKRRFALIRRRAMPAF